MSKPQYLSLVATWQLFCAATSLLGILGLMVVIAMAVNGLHFLPWLYVDPFMGSFGLGGAFAVIAGISFLFLVVFFLISLISGIGSLQGRSWTRTLGIFQAVMSLFNFPVGTVIGILILAYLGKPEVAIYFTEQRSDGNCQQAISSAVASQ